MTTNAQGLGSVTQTVTEGDFEKTLTATAARVSDGATSEFSACREAMPALGIPPSDLVTKITHSPVAPVAGETVTWTVDVQNKGPAKSTGAQVAVDFPANLSPKGSGCIVRLPRLVCPLNKAVPLSSGQHATVTITARLKRGVTTVTATASSDQPDPTLADAKATDAVTVKIGPARSASVVAERLSGTVKVDTRKRCRG